MSEITTSKGIIEYYEHGEGEPLIMLRGLARTVRHWAGFEQMMSRYFRVITFDLRGVGTNKVPLSPTQSLFDIAEDVITVLDHLKIERASILGVSLGGMVAMAAGMTFPERIHSLIVVNSSIAGQRVLRLSPKALATISSATWDREGLENRLIEVLTGPENSQQRKKEIADLYYRIQKEDGLNIRAVSGQLTAAARFYVSDRLKKLRVPTLVLYGTCDQFVPNFHSKRIASLIPTAKLRELKNAGHEAHLDKPDEFIGAVREWHEELRISQGN